MRWQHAPLHQDDNAGVYMITAGTYQKIPYFNSNSRLDLLQESVFSTANEFKWELQAWALLSNHYHMIFERLDPSIAFAKGIKKLHALTARKINKLDNTPGRKIWFQYWDLKITNDRSHMARLKYVNENPVKHGIVTNSELYPWCSASWFSNHLPASYLRTLATFRTDTLKIPDEF